MKTLILVRHAKSSWNQPGLSDFDRPLNDRGKADAPEMAKRLKDRGVKIDLFISSPAKRAKRTARYFAEEFNVPKEEIILFEELYLATSEAFRNAVESVKNKYDTIALFSHNPGITDFVNSMNTIHIDDMPTCAVFSVQANADSWQEFLNADKKFLFFDFPKNSPHTL